MKTLFLNSCMKNIRKYFPEYDECKIDEIRYGIEGIYLSITKLIVISLISYLFNLFHEMLIMLIIFNILRMTGFGIHAKRSIDCWISSTLIFIFFPLLSKIIVIPTAVHTILAIIFLILIVKYAPADTVKHPLIKEKKRNIFKIITTINTFILLMISFFTNNVITNLIMFGILTEIILIHPYTYYLFSLPYNNYKNYGLNNNV